MARLRSPEIGQIWISHALSEPDSSPEASARNGAYRGPLPVRALPRGVSGADLAVSRQPAPRQLWQRGEQVVRIVRLEGAWIVFRELSLGSSQRRMRLKHFLRTSHPKAAS